MGFDGFTKSSLYIESYINMDRPLPFLFKFFYSPNSSSLYIESYINMDRPLHFLCFKSVFYFFPPNSSMPFVNSLSKFGD